MTDVVVIDSEAMIVSEIESVMVIAAGDQGPRGVNGVDGLPGSGIAVQTVLQAAMAIGGGRVVAVDGDGELVYADPSQPTTLIGFLGLSLNAANAGDDVAIRVSGEVEDSGWSWTPNQFLYCGANGVLTHTAPITGHIRILGVAMTPTRILFNPHDPIVIAS